MSRPDEVAAGAVPAHPDGSPRFYVRLDGPFMPWPSTDSSPGGVYCDWFDISEFVPLVVGTLSNTNLIHARRAHDQRESIAQTPTTAHRTSLRGQGVLCIPESQANSRLHWRPRLAAYSLRS
jgi:hypothetical protein